MCTVSKIPLPVSVFISMVLFWVRPTEAKIPQRTGFDRRPVQVGERAGGGVMFTVMESWCPVLAALEEAAQLRAAMSSASSTLGTVGTGIMCLYANNRRASRMACRIITLGYPCRLSGTAFLVMSCNKVQHVFVFLF
jgi:hypothetical protein